MVTARVLVDGRLSTFYPEIRRRIRTLPDDQRHLDLIVVTHLDSDHFRGIAPLGLALAGDTLVVREPHRPVYKE